VEAVLLSCCYQPCLIENFLGFHSQVGEHYASLPERILSTPTAKLNKKAESTKTFGRII